MSSTAQYFLVSIVLLSLGLHFQGADYMAGWACCFGAGAFFTHAIIHLWFAP